jgi:hypothetical protein
VLPDPRLRQPQVRPRRIDQNRPRTVVDEERYRLSAAADDVPPEADAVRLRSGVTASTCQVCARQSRPVNGAVTVRSARRAMPETTTRPLASSRTETGVGAVPRRRTVRIASRRPAPSRNSPMPAKIRTAGRESCSGRIGIVHSGSARRI